MGIAPHKDNEEAAEYLYSLGMDSGLEWVVVRPTDLTNGEVSDYEIHDKPQAGLFGSGTAARANVAKFMMSLATDTKLWEQYKFQMPFLWDTPSNKIKKT